MEFAKAIAERIFDDLKSAKDTIPQHALLTLDGRNEIIIIYKGIYKKVRIHITEYDTDDEIEVEL